jgi:hypothetical protein
MRRRLELATLAAAVSTVVFPASGAHALAGGTAVVAAPGGSAITAGGSATPFTLRLPSAAACAGDSAHGEFRVQSYMVPAAVDPGALTFGSTGPIPNTFGANFRQPLYGPTKSGYVNAQTANADHPTDPGTIVNVPAFSFDVFRPGDVPAGTYNVGLACTKGPASAKQLTAYWNTTMVIAASASDPAGLTWSVPGAAPVSAASAASGATTSPTLATVGAAGAAATTSDAVSQLSRARAVRRRAQ